MTPGKEYEQTGRLMSNTVPSLVYILSSVRGTFAGKRGYHYPKLTVPNRLLAVCVSLLLRARLVFSPDDVHSSKTPE